MGSGPQDQTPAVFALLILNLTALAGKPRFLFHPTESRHCREGGNP
jgi:hypothetical protein